jgi:hypothetical protein
MKYVFALFFAVFIIFCMSFLEGWALMKYWKWFVSEPFSIAQLEYIPAVGLTFFLSFIFAVNNPSTFKRAQETDVPVEDAIVGIVQRVTYVLLALFVGFLFHSMF